MDELIRKLRAYADAYEKEPTGREVEGTVELLENSADVLQEGLCMEWMSIIRGTMRMIILNVHSADMRLQRSTITVSSVQIIVRNAEQG